MTLADGYERRLAKIERTHLGFEDHGILTAFIHVTYGGTVQGIGGYDLRAGNGAAASCWIEFALKACGVDRWERLPGRTVYVLFEQSDPHSPKGIEPLPTEKGQRFMFKEAFNE